MHCVQGDRIRQMKSSGVEKSVWMAHVEVLKDMKNQLEELKKVNRNTGTDASSDFKSIESVEQMEVIIAEQVSIEYIRNERRLRESLSRQFL